jgi:hypothetical protein
MRGLGLRNEALQLGKQAMRIVLKGQPSASGDHVRGTLDIPVLVVAQGSEV